MKFTTGTKVKDIAVSHPAARQLLEDAGVDYCCGGGKSLQEACHGTGTPAEEILSRLEENSRQTSPADANWTAAPLNELTRHIREKHHRYVRQAIPRTQALLEKVVAKHGENHTELAEIQETFAQLGREMIMHMQKEEQILFPYIDALEQAAAANGSIEPPFFQTVKNPISAMMKEHDAAGDLAKQIRGLTGTYTAPADACTSYRALYEELKQFETDLHQHVHLENNILFPRAVEKESAFA